MKKKFTYTVNIQPVANGGYMVTVPALPGCVTQGDTYQHAVDMAKDAIQGYLNVLLEDGDPIPQEPEPHQTLAVGVSVEMPMAL